MLTNTQRAMAFSGATASDAIADLHLRLLSELDDARIVHFSMFQAGDHVEGAVVVDLIPSVASVARDLAP